MSEQIYQRQRNLEQNLSPNSSASSLNGRSVKSGSKKSYKAPSAFQEYKRLLTRSLLKRKVETTGDKNENHIKALNKELFYRLNRIETVQNAYDKDSRNLNELRRQYQELEKFVKATIDNDTFDLLDLNGTFGTDERTLFHLIFSPTSNSNPYTIDNLKKDIVGHVLDNALQKTNEDLLAFFEQFKKDDKNGLKCLNNFKNTTVAQLFIKKLQDNNRADVFTSLLLDSTYSNFGNTNLFLAIAQTGDIPLIQSLERLISTRALYHMLNNTTTPEGKTAMQVFTGKLTEHSVIRFQTSFSENLRKIMIDKMKNTDQNTVYSPQDNKRRLDPIISEYDSAQSRVELLIGDLNELSDADTQLIFGTSELKDQFIADLIKKEFLNGRNIFHLLTSDIKFLNKYDEDLEVKKKAFSLAVEKMSSEDVLSMLQEKDENGKLPLEKRISPQLLLDYLRVLSKKEDVNIYELIKDLNNVNDESLLVYLFRSMWNKNADIASAIVSSMTTEEITSLLNAPYSRSRSSENLLTHFYERNYVDIIRAFDKDLVISLLVPREENDSDEIYDEKVSDFINSKYPDSQLDVFHYLFPKHFQSLVNWGRPRDMFALSNLHSYLNAYFTSDSKFLDSKEDVEDFINLYEEAHERLYKVSKEINPYNKDATPETVLSSQGRIAHARYNFAKLRLEQFRKIEEGYNGPMLNLEKLLKDSERANWDVMPASDDVNDASWTQLEQTFSSLATTLFPDDESFATNLNSFYKKTMHSKDAQHSALAKKVVRQRVSNVIAYVTSLNLEQSPDNQDYDKNLKKAQDIMSLLADGGSACPDRVIVMLTKAENYIKMNAKSSDGKDYSTNVLVNIFKYNLIEAKLTDPSYKEALEQYLYYTLQFNQALDLGLTTKDMLYYGVVKFEHDIRTAIDMVCQAFTQEDLIGFIALQESFREIAGEAEANELKQALLNVSLDEEDIFESCGNDNIAQELNPSNPQNHELYKRHIVNTLESYINNVKTSEIQVDGLPQNGDLYDISNMSTDQKLTLLKAVYEEADVDLQLEIDSAWSVKIDDLVSDIIYTKKAEKALIDAGFITYPN